MHFFKFFLFTLIVACFSSNASDWTPVAYKGRFRPLEAYQRMWYYEYSHSQSVKNEDVLWGLDLLGYEAYSKEPLFWIDSAELKRQAQLDPKKSLFSYDELNKIGENQDTAKLSQLLKQFETYGQTYSLLKMLPSRSGEWLSIHTLKSRSEDNFTVYKDKTFYELKKAYLNWESAFKNKKVEEAHTWKRKLLDILKDAYKEIEGTPYQKSHLHSLTYPTITQLKWEAFYYAYPLIEIAIFIYALALIAAIYLGGYHPTILFGIFAIPALWHTAILIMRAFILGRPPVSNMFETVIYVPWIAVLLSLFLYIWRNSRSLLVASGISALILLIILKLTDINHSMENVQPVLNSQFWLIIHVLMIVASYGIFILGGIAAHIYLVGSIKGKQNSTLVDHIIQTLYIGTALLIAGTFLGGVWAAQSWGRFWDWDPKESWAFISACIYLLIIHAYRFKKIGSFGLAVGSIIGLLGISFTWYGVNYILGTGLHSYGFGKGGQGYYYSYVLMEIIFIFFITKSKLNKFVKI